MVRGLMFVLVIISISCSSAYKNGKLEKSNAKAESIIGKAILAHGGHRYDNSHYSFDFRNKNYTFQNLGVRYTYTVESIKDGKVIFDRMDNHGFTRTIDGNPTRLSEKQNTSYSSSLNSVIYFATLPHKLKDQAVIKSYVGDTKIKGEKYHVIKIMFTEEGGGQDHDDIFHYWVGKEDNIIDYIAYNYRVNGGGVRFRSAYNQRTVDGVIFQDYINFKAEVGTSLFDLPKLYENNKLKKLSLIETENVVSIKK